MYEPRRSAVWLAIGATDPSRGALDRICTTACSLLDATAVGIVLMSGVPGGSVMIGDSGGALALGELEFGAGQGPGADAFRDGVTVTESDLSGAGLGRWPAFSEAAVATGIHGVVALPLRLGAIRPGVLCVYRAARGDLSQAQYTDALLLAEMALLVLIEQRSGVTDVLRPELTEGWDRRAMVHQAAGMVSVQLELSIEDALARLRAHAYAEGLSVYALAGDVVERRLRLEP